MEDPRKFVFFLGSLAISVFHWTEKRPDAVEQGCRVQMQRLRTERIGSPQATPIHHLEAPIWRGDFFSLAEGAPGNNERAHHHLTWTGQQPGPRVFDPQLKADPVAWFERRLDDLPGLLRECGAEDVAAGLDLAGLASLKPAILGAVRICMK